MLESSGESRTGLVFVDTYGHRRDYTFGEIADRSQRYAAVLRALGVREGERVAMCTSSHAWSLFLMLALERLGSTPIVLAEDLSYEEILERIRTGGVTTVISNRRRRAELEPLQCALPAATLFALLGDEGEGWARIDTLAASAKGWAGSGPEQSEEMRTAADALDSRPGDRCWTALPFAPGAWAAYTKAPLWSGASLVLHEHRFDAAERLDLLRELDVTVLCQPAAEYDELLSLPAIAALRRTRLRHCVALGGDEALRKRWLHATGKSLVPGTSSEWNLQRSPASPPTR